MYVITMLKNSEVIDVIDFVNSREEYETVVNGMITQYGAEWLGENNIWFGFERAF